MPSTAINLALLLSLLTLSTATPISSSLHPRSPPAPDHSLCAAATNCEIYTDRSGSPRIRFRPGMEPGSTDYHRRHSKRQTSPPTTQVTIGDQKIVWGCGIDPVAMLGNLSAPCLTTGACDTSQPFTTQVPYFDVTSTDVGPPQPQTLSIKGTGTYPAWMRNGLVDAVQAAASANGLIEWHNNVQWFAGPGKKRDTGPSSLQGVGGSAEGPSGGTCSAAVFSTFVGIGVFDAGTGDMQATMQAEVQMGSGSGDGGFCGDTQGLDLATAVSGAFGAWGAGIAAILGTVKASCGGS